MSLSNDQYSTDEKVKQYEKFIDNCLMRQHIKGPSIKLALGIDLSGKRCLDVACGYGGSTKWLADLNPAELIGVDLSPAMIDEAKRRFSRDPKYANIKLLVRDGCEPLGLGQFDVVHSSFFLSHAETREALEKMIQVLSEATKSNGGVCVGLITSPHFTADQYHKMNKYSIEFVKIDSENPNKHRVRFHSGPVGEGTALCEVDQYSWEPELYERLFKSSGFGHYEWIMPRLFDESLKEHFADFFEVNPYRIFRAIKS